MRHTSHIMLGADAASMLKDIKQYVIKYGDEEMNDYFKAFLFPELDPSAEACFQIADPVKADESVFVAGIDEMFDVQLGKSYKVLPNSRQDYLKGFFRTLYDRSITINRYDIASIFLFQLTILIPHLKYMVHIILRHI